MKMGITMSGVSLALSIPIPYMTNQTGRLGNEANNCGVSICALTIADLAQQPYYESGIRCVRTPDDDDGNTH
jgi:hypothetical protein